MDYVLNLLPDDPIDCRKYLSPSMAISLDNEICSILWVAYSFISMTKVFPAGIQFTIHADFEERQDHEDEEDDGQVIDDSSDESSDDDDETRVNFDLNVMFITWGYIQSQIWLHILIP